jgi:hypothetical protein
MVAAALSGSKAAELAGFEPRTGSLPPRRGRLLQVPLLDRSGHGQERAVHDQPELTISHSHSPPWAAHHCPARVQVPRRPRSLPPRAPAPADLLDSASSVGSLLSPSCCQVVAHQWTISPLRGDIDRADGVSSIRTRPSADLMARRWACPFEQTRWTTTPPRPGWTRVIRIAALCGGHVRQASGQRPGLRGAAKGSIGSARLALIIRSPRLRC